MSEEPLIEKRLLWMSRAACTPSCSLIDRVPDFMFGGHPHDMAIFAGFHRESLVKFDYRKYVPCCFTTAYTQNTFEVLDRTRLSSISKIRPAGRIFRIGHIAPVAQWTE
jgi:hypothetical protein